MNASILQNYGAAKKDGKLDSVIKLIEDWSGESLGCADDQDSASETSDYQPNSGLDLSKSGKKSYALHVANYDFRSTGCHYVRKLSAKCNDKDQRGYCIVCSKRCTTTCAVCGVSMCIEGLEKENCFYRFHTMKKYKD